ncbi:MAG TPA: ATP synthase subunit I [Candidatus Methanoperedens sp.]|nr:ATP synthase subunit I [Candidatus Methanoperedens sp.]
MSLDAADRIERTAWALGGLLLAASLLWRSLTVTAGVGVGVLLAVLNYRSLVRFVRTLVASGAPALPRARYALYLSKYALSAAVVVAALKFRIADPIALLVGASVLLPALLREAAHGAAAPTRKEA